VSGDDRGDGADDVNDGADVDDDIGDIDDVVDLTGTPSAPTGGGALAASPSPDADPAPFPGDGDGDEDADRVEPVELLVQLAERGEIEPWDIDVVRVTDAFLEALDDADLRAGGRALFYASVLLRMKSDALMDDDAGDGEETDEARAPEDEPWAPVPEGVPGGFAGGAGDGADGEYGADPFDALEREMERRIERKRARGMPRTLDELVRELREAERGTYWKESRTYDTSDSPRGYARGTQTLDYHAADDRRLDGEPDVEEVTERTHDEEMEATIRRVYRALCEQYDRGREEVLFAEIDGEGGSRVRTFLAVLFLDHRGRIRLRQDELFGDLWVQDPAGARAGDEAVADD